MNDRLSKFVFVAIISISSLEIKDCFYEHFLLHNHSLNFLILDIGLLLLSLRWLKDILLHIIHHIILILLLHEPISYLLCLLNLLLNNYILQIFHFKLINSLLFVQLVCLELLHAPEYRIVLNILLRL